MVPDLANQKIPEHHIRPQEIPEDVRGIARLFGLCFQTLKTPNGYNSNHLVMHQAIYESINTIIPKEKRIYGGVVCDMVHNKAYVFGEFKEKNSTQEKLNTLPYLDDSFFGDGKMEFVEIPINELENYLGEVFTEHNNNGRKTAVEFTPYIQKLN